MSSFGNVGVRTLRSPIDEIREARPRYRIAAIPPFKALLTEAAAIGVEPADNASGSARLIASLVLQDVLQGGVGLSRRYLSGGGHVACLSREAIPFKVGFA